MRYSTAAIAVAVILLGRSGWAQQASTSTAEDNTSAKTDAGGWSFTWNNRPSLRYGDLLRIDFRARMVTDLRGSGAVEERNDERFDIPRRRVGISGDVGERADFQVERELGDRRPGWRDVYLNLRASDRMNLQGGQFKLPFGLDENTSSTNLDFVYRSRAAALSPGRDPGAMAHGRIRILRYAAGVFVRDGDNGRDESLSASRSSALAGRLLVQPWRASKSVLEDFQAGVAFTTSDAASSVADLRGPTALGTPFPRPEFAVNGARRRAGLEMRWRPGPFSVQSEWIRLTSERRGQSVEDTDLPALTAAAWYVQGTWVATGEKKAGGADEPRRPLFRGGFGSLEFAARAEGIRFSSGGTGLPSLGPRAETILPQVDRALTLGVNWSPNRWFRVQANLVRDTMSEPASSFWSRVVRLRFAM